MKLNFYDLIFMKLNFYKSIYKNALNTKFINSRDWEPPEITTQAKFNLNMQMLDKLVHVAI